MMKTTWFLICALAWAGSLQAQKYFTRNGKISFYGSTPVEKIEAHSTSASSVLDSQNGAIEFSVPLKSFHFEKALMEEHFNENYVESHKPGNQNATFAGTVVNMADVNLKKDGDYEVTIQGKLTLHGKTQEITAKGVIRVKGSEVKAKCDFEIKPEDYDIEIPDLVRDKIAKVIEVKVRVNYQPMKR